MQLNADFSKRVVIESAREPWVPSPLPGVERRLLDRIGGEVARATSIVRYAPESFFSAHTHGGGEEFLVLDGVFSDEHGDYGPGFYLRNPVGSRHTPFSRTGCTIFVKLWQMDPDDREFLRVDTANAVLQAGDAAGIAFLPLAERADETVRLERWAPGTSAGERHYPGGAEVLVLAGAFADEAGRYPEGTWLRLPPGSRHAPRSREGCRLWLKTGHLLAPRGLELAAE